MLAIPCIFDILQAMAGMEDEKATPYGSPLIEISKAAPFIIKIE